MNKKKEIELLEKLKDDSYLLDSVGVVGISKMIDNVKGDHPIETGVFVPIHINEKQVNENIQKINSLESEIKELKAQSLKVKKETIEFKLNILNDLVRDNTKEGLKIAKKYYSVHDVILAKLKFDLKLTHDENMYIISQFGDSNE